MSKPVTINEDVREFLRMLSAAARRELERRRKSKSKPKPKGKRKAKPQPQATDDPVLYRVFAEMDECDHRALQRAFASIQAEGDIPSCDGNLVGRLLGELARSWLAYRELPIPKIYFDPDGNEHIIDGYCNQDGEYLPPDDDVDELDP